MNLKTAAKHWTALGKIDPLWAILTLPEKMGNKWDTSEFFQAGTEHVNSLLAQLDSLGIPLKRGKALDFGCGVGRLTQALAPFFEEVAGVDIAPSMIELANRYNKHANKCTYYLNQTDELSLFPDGVFDFVCSFITLQHIRPRDAKKYIMEFLRILAPGGVLVFQLPHKTEGFRSKFIGFGKRIPGFRTAYRLYRKIRYGHSWVIEMHTINRNEVVRLLKDNGGLAIYVKEDHSAMGFTSYCYYVLKQECAR